MRGMDLKKRNDMEEERISADDFAQMVVLKWCIDCIESSDYNCGDVQTRQMKRIFAGLFNETAYADVTDEQLKELDVILEEFEKEVLTNETRCNEDI